MAFKILAFAALLALANAGAMLPSTESYEAQESTIKSKLLSPPAVKEVKTSVPVKTLSLNNLEEKEADAKAQYSYSYNVQDGVTGDNKQHHETRNGDLVEGSYSLLEADGSRRTVHYTADSVNGFNAVVDKQVPSAAVQISNQKPLVVKSTPTVTKFAPAPAPLTIPIEQPIAPINTYPPPMFAHSTYPLAYNQYSSPIYTAPMNPTLFNMYPAPSSSLRKVNMPVASPVLAYDAFGQNSNPFAFNNYAEPIYSQQMFPVTYPKFSAPLLNKISAAPITNAPVGYHSYGSQVPTFDRLFSQVAFDSYKAPYGRSINHEASAFFH